MPGSAARLLPESLEALPAAAYTCDRGGSITSFNRKAAALWGREPLLNDPRDRFCGSFKLFLPDGSPLPRDRCWMALALREDREILGNELVIERSDGSRVCALSSASPVHDASGALVGAIHVLVDITDRKRRDAAQAEEQDRLEDAGARKEFLATLAHELRNPLAPLLQGLELLRQQRPVRRAAGSVHDMMERQLAQLARLIDDLLDVGRIGAGKFDIRAEPIDVADVVRLAVETTRGTIRKAGHELHIALPGQALPLHADLVRLAQVLTNLLNNSARYTHDGGRISLVVERDDGAAVIRVKDNGIGIPPALLPQIFELFTQARADASRSGGLGVGLNIARRLVQLHGGTLTAHSAGEGAGSEFTVRLPLARGSGAVA